MKILTRYLLRSHAGPFLFAFTILTGLIFLNAVAGRLDDLAGKGLPTSIIVEFMLLTLPHVVALTLPMSVLVAVLYTISDLTAGNELTAMSAGGVQPRRLVIPMVGMGLFFTVVMLYFNDQVLPETNHRLKNLSVDIGQKSPTFRLREQVVNEIRSADGRTRVFLKAAVIDPVTSELTDVEIYDLSEVDRIRSIRADSGAMAFNESQTDLYLTLYDGELREVQDRQPAQFNRLFFQSQVVPLRGISNILNRENDVSRRSDREMSIGMLQEAADQELVEVARIQDETLGRSRYAVRRSLGLLGRVEPFDDWDRRALSGDAGTPPPEATPRPDDQQPGTVGGSAPISSAPAVSDAVRFAALQEEARRPMMPDGVTRSVNMTIRTNDQRREVLLLQRSRYEVEVHKKLSISVACLVFVLLGLPVAVRFPRGGVGMVIAVSVGIFAVYWISLIGGERLADRGVMSPFWAMWTPNFIFLTLGIWMTMRLGRAGSTNRGGGWDDLIYTVRTALLPGRRSKGTAS